jgi:hydrogenase maturation protein HypF
MALSYLRYAYGDEYRNLDIPLMKELDGKDIDIIDEMIGRALNSPLTSSCGRVFDGVSALLGICRDNHYEAQAAILLETAASTHEQVLDREKVEVGELGRGAISFNWLIRLMVEGLNTGVSISTLARRFHVLLSEILVQAAIAAREETAIAHVGLSGGVYQNVLFFTLMRERLIEEGFTVLAHSDVPTNDGGLALGQTVIADAMINNS